MIIKKFCSIIGKTPVRLLGTAQTISSTPQLTIPGSFRHADICQKTKHVVADLIKQDANDHHIFFNHKEYHNHTVHQLLAQFSLGADEKRLKECFKNERKIMRLALPEKSDFQWDGKHCLGNEDYYTSYLKYFIGEVKKKGIVPCIEEYIFNDKSSEMFTRFMFGYYHIMIRIGYGVEFGIPLIVAEGLAEAAVHKTTLKPLFGNGPPKLKEIRNTKHATALDLVKKAKNDNRFDNLIKFEDDPKLVLVAEKVPQILLEYGSQWIVREQSDGEEGLQARSTELQALGAVLCMGTQPVDKQIRIDFLLLHILTSATFLHALVEQLTPANAASLLRAKFLVDLTLYVAFNRPTINLDQFKEYPKKSWDELIRDAIAHDDVHVPKAIRALKHASAYDKTIDPEIYNAMAQMIIDGDGWWLEGSTGFEEAWKNVPARGVKSEPQNRTRGN